MYFIYLSVQGKFIEHGEFRGNLYGTSVDGVAELISAGYQPILTPHHQVTKFMHIFQFSCIDEQSILGFQGASRRYSVSFVNIFSIYIHCKTKTKKRSRVS